MTTDRRKHRREPIAWLDGEFGGGRRRAHRDPAEAHFRRLGESAAEPGEHPTLASNTAPCRFEVGRAGASRAGAIDGGEWLWLLRDATGRVLVSSGGYRDECACRQAVAILRTRAAHATAPEA